MLGKRIPTLLAMLLLVVAVAAAWFWKKNSVTVTSEEIVPQSVKITNIADNKFSVSWTTKIPTSGSVEYGRVGEKLDKQKSDDRGETYQGLTHHVTVTDLQPKTNYSFRIMSGPESKRFDNEGSVYTTMTGSTIASVPAARSLYGDVRGGSQDAILYITLPNAAPSSVVLNSSGSYSVAVSTMRSDDLESYVTYDPAATVVSLILDNGQQTSRVSVSTTNMAPVPTITLGSDADFRVATKPVVEETEQAAQVAQVEPQGLDILNIEPIEDSRINEITDAKYTLTNPATEGEVLSTTKPEFRGTGAANAEIQVAVTGQKTVSDTLRIGGNGSWSWTPAIALAVGKQKITISYKDKDGKAQTIVRNFSVTATTTTSEPAFVSTPSANINNSGTTSASPRANMPATDSGIPTTGVMTPMLLTLAFGFAIMVTGAFILAL